MNVARLMNQSVMWWAKGANSMYPNTNYMNGVEVKGRWEFRDITTLGKEKDEVDYKGILYTLQEMNVQDMVCLMSECMGVQSTQNPLTVARSFIIVQVKKEFDLNGVFSHFKILFDHATN